MITTYDVAEPKSVAFQGPGFAFAIAAGDIRFANDVKDLGLTLVGPASEHVQISQLSELLLNLSEGVTSYAEAAGSAFDALTETQNQTDRNTQEYIRIAHSDAQAVMIWSKGQEYDIDTTDETAPHGRQELFNSQGPTLQTALRRALSAAKATADSTYSFDRISSLAKLGTVRISRMRNWVRVQVLGDVLPSEPPAPELPEAKPDGQSV